MGANLPLAADLETFQELSKQAHLLGLLQGRAEGQRALLTKQLRLKFGPLPATVEDRLATADVRHLESWAARILTASRLDQIWAS